MNQERLHFYMAIFVSSLGLGAYSYFVPVFAQTFGATFFDLGVIGSANSLAYALTPMVAGYLIDRFNRSWIFASALLINAVATIILVLSRSVSDILVLRLLAGLGLGFFWPVADALVTDLATPERRVAEMGWYSVAWGLGYLIGPSMGGLVVQRFGYFQLFVLSTALIVLALLIDIVWIVPKYRQRIELPRNLAGGNSSTRRLLPWYMMLLCCTMVVGVIGGIFPGYANSVGIGPELIGLLFTAYGISRTLFSAMSERYSNFREKTALGFTSILMAFGSLLIAIFPNFYGFLAGVIMIGGAFGAIFPISISLISRHFPPDRMGAAMGSFETTLGIGFAVGPLLAGLVAVLSNLTMTFLVTALFGIMALVFLSSGSTYLQNGSEKNIH